MVTSLNPLIGYDTAAAIAKEAFKTGKTVRDLCLEKIKAGTLKKKDSDAVVTEAELNAALDPRRDDGAGERIMLAAAKTDVVLEERSFSASWRSRRSSSALVPG